jgi:S1-C subfamily serine protease
MDMDEHEDPFGDLNATPDPAPVSDHWTATTSDPWGAPRQEPVPHHARSGRRWTIGTALGALVVLGSGVGLGLGVGHATTSGQPSNASSSEGVVAPPTGAVAGPGFGRMDGYGHRGGGFYGYGSGGSSGSANGSGGTSSTSSATAAQQVGVVDIVVALGYQQAEAAGTGMILTSSGEVLTNNHVIDGATSIKVTVVSTGKTYTASVLGDDPTHDVALVQLKGASGLQTVKTASAAATVGNTVVGVGNAGGAGGTPSAAAGKVVALGQAITARDDDGSNPERLTNLIETDAPIASGDSGGPLFNSASEVVGMDTAISAGQQVQAYAIPISRALSIAKQIESGKSSGTVHVGSTAFLGVGLEDTSSGVAVTSVVSGSPADSAGLQAGDVITAVGGTSISSAEGLTTVMQAHSPGDRVTLHWTQESGQTSKATVTLVAGPAK